MSCAEIMYLTSRLKKNAQNQFDAQLFLDWAEDLDRHVQILLEVQFCRVWPSEITMTLSISPYPQPWQATANPLGTFPCTAGVWDTQTIHRHFWWKTSYLFPLLQKNPIKHWKINCCTEKLGHGCQHWSRTSQRWLSVCQICHFCIAQTSGAGLQPPTSTIIQHQVNSPDMQSPAWLPEGKHKIFYNFLISIKSSLCSHTGNFHRKHIYP